MLGLLRVSGQMVHPHIRAGHTFDLCNGIVTKVYGFMSSPDRILVRSAHKAERFSLPKVDVRCVSKCVELRCNLFQFVELRQKLLLSQLINGKTPFGFVMGIDEVSHRTVCLVHWLTALLAVDGFNQPNHYVYMHESKQSRVSLGR